MATALAIVKTEEQKPQPKREHIQLIETQPKDEWFVQSRTSHGRKVWYLRFEVTGLNPRLFGPFRSKRVGLLCLDNVLDALGVVAAEVQDACEKRMLEEECQKVWPPIIEYPILTQLQSPTKKGR